MLQSHASYLSRPIVPSCAPRQTAICPGAHVVGVNVESSSVKVDCTLGCHKASTSAMERFAIEQFPSPPVAVTADSFAIYAPTCSGVSALQGLSPSGFFAEKVE